MFRPPPYSHEPHRWTWLLIAALAAFSIFCFLTVAHVHADPGSADPNQPRPDLFPSGVAQHPSLDYYSTLDDKVEQQGNVLWALDVQQGCSSAGVSSALSVMFSDLYANTSTAGIYVDATKTKPDLTIKIRCGATAAAEGVSGGVVGCLCYSFPYNNDVAINDVITTYPLITMVSIFCHEVCGHAFSVWNEQYCPGYDARLGCSGLFAAVPNWVDIMNTGPDSRHYWGPTEDNRWGRTHGSGAPTSLGRGNGYVWFCGSGSGKGVAIALYSWDGVPDGLNGTHYKYVGSVPLANLPADRNGCRGMQTDGYVVAGEQACIDFWNRVDYLKFEFRSDRCA